MVQTDEEAHAAAREPAEHETTPSEMDSPMAVEIERTEEAKQPAVDPTQHPVVKRALELFNGKIVEVHPRKP